VLDWHHFAAAAPDISAAGRRLLELNEVAFLATASATHRPRIHPFVPRIVAGRFVAFIMDSSPKFNDLQIRRQYSVHTLPGEEDEEFFAGGEADCCDGEAEFRNAAADAMGFAAGIDQHHVLFEFRFDRALHTRWLDFGSSDHRPQRVRWTLQQ